MSSQSDGQVIPISRRAGSHGTTGVMIPASGGETKSAITIRSAEPAITSTVNAQLAVVPDPLRLLHGPLLATLETWSDGTVVARLPAVAIYAEGENDTLALAALADEVLSLAADVARTIERGDRIGGPLQYQWRALTALVDVSGLTR